jgi:hypothetical protein
VHVTEGQRERERVRACVRFALAGLSTQTRSFVCFCSVVLLFEIAFLISGLLSAGFEAGSRGISAGKRGKGQEGKEGRERERER